MRRNVALRAVGEKTAEGLEEIYASIAAAQPAQEENYAYWIQSAVDAPALEAAAARCGLTLDVARGVVSYAPGFAAPALDFELWYCRHGKTTGNTEPRVYQGYVDEPSNALNEIGLQQAEDAAQKLEALGLEPDLVVLSPLARAADTGKAFLKRRSDIAVATWESTAEMKFGDWDNVMVKDLPKDSICHLFYLAQSASSRPAGLRRGRRAAAAKGGGKRVLLYGHSMCGAALGILTGNGKVVDGESFLGFDGKHHAQRDARAATLNSLRLPC
ncbi:Histidine phosphatase [Aureococcus anophagefferens]|nr:Histidine phosphatase [Aureococcus anophagefferens]